MRDQLSQFVEAADFIGAKLCRDAIWAGQRCNWFGVSVRARNRSVELDAQSVCGSDFYSGTSGIAVFLARLFAATGEKIFRVTAEGAIRQALSRLDHFPRKTRIDFYGGLTGVAYGLLEIAESCGVNKFNDIGLLIMEDAAGADSEVHSSAETVDGLLRMHDRHKKDFLLQLATRVGEEVRNGAIDLPNSEQLSSASAMLALFKATGNADYKQAAERFLLDAACSQSEVTIARANLRAFEVLGENNYAAHARKAIEAVNSRVESSSNGDLDFSLAHGLAGHGDLLLEASRVLGDERLLRAADKVGNWGIERYKKHDLPWPCGSANGWDAPSLMIGLAGIGYFYLRLHDSSRVPSLVSV